MQISDHWKWNKENREICDDPGDGYSYVEDVLASAMPWDIWVPDRIHRKADKGITKEYGDPPCSNNNHQDQRGSSKRWGYKDSAKKD